MIARGLAAAHATTITTSAPARMGEAATTTANRIEAVAPALHERRASIPARTRNGNARCTSTPVGRPSARAASRGGASTHSAAARIGGHRRSLSRVAHHHAPSAARGRAVNQSSTRENEGFQAVRLPSTATTALKGSAGPLRPTAPSRGPMTRFVHRAGTEPPIGRSAPPRMTSVCRSLQKTITPSTPAARTTHAPPPAKNDARTSSGSTSTPDSCSRRAARRSRISSLGTRSDAIADHGIRRERRSRRRAGATVRSKAAANPLANSPPIRFGRLPTRWPIERTTARGTSASQCSSTEPPAA